MKSWILCVALLLPGFSMAQALSFDDAVAHLQKRWAQIKYQVKDHDLQVIQMDHLIKQAEKISAHYPQKAEPKIWYAIILSTQAGQKGGLGALNLVRDAKNLLEDAEKINPTALKGSIYTSLGSMYYQVPGWPISFGSNDKAEAALKKALTINPNGIDPNFFYADFLKKQGKKEEALRYFMKAYNAPKRADRPLADQGRRLEIQAALKELQQK